ncbi:MAG: hypothetical protein ACLTX6_02140 [Lachnospiraceae bacterium]
MNPSRRLRTKLKDRWQNLYLSPECSSNTVKNTQNCVDRLGNEQQKPKDAREEVDKMVRSHSRRRLGRRMVLTSLRCTVGRKSVPKNVKKDRFIIEPQGFCVLAGVGIEEGLAEQALDSVRRNTWIPNMVL